VLVSCVVVLVVMCCGVGRFVVAPGFRRWDVSGMVVKC
jgi:hypothetical protein